MIRRASHAALLATALVAAGCWVGAAVAQGVVAPPTQGGPAWSSLSKSQQDALAPLQREWPQIDADRKKKWLEVASRFPNMPVAERTRIQERMAEWARLSPAERGQARMQFQQSRQFAPEDRQARWEAYSALPEDQRAELAKRGKPAPPATKAVSPTVVQVKPGATTTLMSAPPKPPVHQQSGLPKIAATEGFVDKQTLLPKRGPQGAAVRSAAAASAAPDLTP